MRRNLQVTKGKPGTENEKPKPGTFNTPFGVLTITEKGTSSTAHTSPPRYMPTKKKYRPIGGK